MSPHTTTVFRDSILAKDEFTITYELVPGRGSGGKRLEKILRFAELAKADGRINPCPSLTTLAAILPFPPPL